jgi:Protein of unknown function (DUF3179)
MNDELKGPPADHTSQSNSDAKTPPRRSSAAWLPLLFSAAAAGVGFGCFAYPMYVIRPFRHQGAQELALALAVKQAAPVVTILCAAIVIVCLIAFRRRYKMWSRILAILFAVVTCGSIWLARFNVYEVMFHPMGTPAAEPVETAKIDPDDMVLAVNVNDSARAYPIRTMGYHHIANDWVGGEPIVATY